jgi:tetratricopeptide (TPR) repeat protein
MRCEICLKKGSDVRWRLHSWPLRMPSKPESSAAIIRGLLAISLPLKAREISRRLRISLGISIDTNEVNSALYGPLSSEVTRLADYSWKLKPVSVRKIEKPALPPQSNANEGKRRTSSADFEIQLRKAMDYLRSSNFQHCIDACKKASSLNPTAAMPHCLRARAYIKLGSPKKAAEHFEKAIKLGPKLGKNDLLACAEAYEQAGNSRRAADLFAEIAVNGLTTRSIWRAYLCSLRNSFQFEELLRVSARANRLFPKDPEILWRRAVALEKLERYAEAHATYEGILAINPDHEGARAGVQSLSPQVS